MSASNRRPRFRAEIRALLRSENGEIRAGRTIELNRTGALLRGVSMPPPDRVVHLTLEPPWPDLRVRGRIRIGGVESAADGRTATAVEFLDLSDEDRDRLDRLVCRIAEGREALAVAGLGPKTPAEEIRRSLGKIPLAHRVQLALRADAEQRRVLLEDPHPAVLDALARNPNLRPAEARSLVALPRIPPTTLAVLGNDSRWGVDLMVRIACHPRTPADAASRIVDRLAVPDLRRVAADPRCPASLRPRIRRKIGPSP